MITSTMPCWWTTQVGATAREALDNVLHERLNDDPGMGRCMLHEMAVPQGLRPGMFARRAAENDTSMLLPGQEETADAIRTAHAILRGDPNAIIIVPSIYRPDLGQTWLLFGRIPACDSTSRRPRCSTH